MIALFIVAAVAVHLVPQLVTAKLLGVPARWVLWFPARPPRRAWRDVVAILAGWLGTYVLAATLIQAHLMTTGMRMASARVRVVAVDPDGAAAKVLERGDQLVAIDGAIIVSTLEVREVMDRAAGPDVTVTVERQGQRMTLPVPLRPAHRLGITMEPDMVDQRMSAGEALPVSLGAPWAATKRYLRELGRRVHGDEVEIMGPFSMADLLEDLPPLLTGFERIVAVGLILAAWDLVRLLMLFARSLRPR